LSKRVVFEGGDKTTNLNGQQNLGLLEVTLALNLGTSGVDVGTRVELEKLAEIELGGLEDLDLTDEDITEGVDRLAGLLDLVSDNLGDELVDELLQVAGGGLGDHDLEHLLANLTDLSSLGVGGLLDLVDTLLGEGNSEETEQVTIGGLDINVSLDDGLPLADHGAELVRGHVHTVEVGEAVLALDLIDTQLDLAERVLLVLVQVSEGDLEDTALQRVVGVLHALGTVNEGLANLANVEGGRSLDIIPVLAGEGVNDLLLKTLLAFRETLILSNGHDVLS